MSLFRSQSASGGLSINTTAANSASAQPAATGGLFGQSSTATPASTAGNTTTAAPTMASGGGLFGGSTAAKPSGGLFGSSTTATSAPATGSGGLFGGGAAATSSSSGGGGLFGGGAAASSTTGTAAATTQAPKPGGGLFGGGGNTQTTQPASGGGGLFGNAGNTGQQQTGTAAGNTTTTTGGGLFGQAQTPSQPAGQSSSTTTGGGLFGGGATASNTTTNTTSNAQTSTLGGGLFGQSQAAKPATGGMFGASQAAQTQQPSVAAVQVNYDNLRPRSRFDDLAQPVQDEIALIDKGIQRVIKMKDQIGEFMPQHERDIEQLGRDVKFVEAKFRTVQVALNKDIQAVKALQDMTKKNIADAQLSFKAADNLKLPTHYHTTGLFATGSAPEGKGAGSGAVGASASSTHASAQDLISYFNRVCDSVEKYKKRLDDYRLDIERDMPGVENGLYEQIRAFRDRNAGAAATAASLGGGSMQDQLGQVLSALKETGHAIVAQAGQIADTRERLSRLQAGIVDSGVYAAGMTA